ncbi:MAG TPA: transposase [Nevskiaceae bacterium]|nr:transposase [Nevskiaceae bacterium]
MTKYTGKVSAPTKKQRGPKCANPRAVRLSTNARVANVSNLRLVTQVDDHVRGLKNRMSSYCHEHLTMLVADPYAFKRNYTRFGSRFLLAWEVQHVFDGVVDAYLNAFQRRLKNRHFYVQRRFVIEHYQRDGKGFRKGDVRDCHVVLGPGRYSALVKYLCYCPSLELDALAGTKVYDACLAIATDKPAHWARIQRLAALAQRHVLWHVHRIRYRSGSYQRNVRESHSFIFRDTTNTKYQWFYRYRTGKGKDATTVILPLLVNPQKHDFDKMQLDGNHTVHVRDGKFHVVVTQESTPVSMQPQGRVVGGDANCKHNLLQFSNGLEVRYDEGYLQVLIAELQGLDARGTDKTRVERQRQEKLYRRNAWYWQHLVHDVLDTLEAEGVTDIVLEDLRRFPATFLRNRPLDIKYSRLITLLRLSNLKQWFKQQALKRGIRVHLTPPHYSSQHCRRCGYTARSNRKTQERFKCAGCSYEINADLGASLNLEDRLTSDVLRQRLHDVDEHGCLVPKPHLTKYQIRRILDESGPREVLTVPPASRVFVPRLRVSLGGSSIQTR